MSIEQGIRDAERAIKENQKKLAELKKQLAQEKKRLTEQYLGSVKMDENGNIVFITKIEGSWIHVDKFCIEYYYDMVDEREVMGMSDLSDEEAAALANKIMKTFEKMRAKCK